MSLLGDTFLFETNTWCGCVHQQPPHYVKHTELQMRCSCCTTTSTCIILPLPAHPQLICLNWQNMCFPVINPDFCRFKTVNIEKTGNNRTGQYGADNNWAVFPWLETIMQSLGLFVYFCNAIYLPDCLPVSCIMPPVNKILVQPCSKTTLDNQIMWRDVPFSLFLSIHFSYDVKLVFFSFLFFPPFR